MSLITRLMNIMTSRTYVFFIVILGLFLFQTPARATLGERAVASLAQNKSLVTPNNTTVRFQSSVDDVVTIKEFIDSTGIIYAIRWDGPRPPDLNSLLGQFFPEYKVAIVSTPFRVPHRRLMADSDNLHISQFGRPGNLSGIVYLKNRLPANIHPDDLK
jgi:hypothetical protein